MARKLRIQYEGAVYHVMSRGDRREPVFKDDHDRKTFLETLAQCCARTQWEVYRCISLCDGDGLRGKRFRKELLAELAGGVGREHYGEERWESEVERVVREELRRAGWAEAQLGSTAKGHKLKVRLAVRLRRDTMMPYEWIAARLQMGSRSNASNLVYAKQNCKK